MNGGMDGEDVEEEEEDTRGAEAFEVWGGCRSLLKSQLRALDLCRFQGSVCRPKEDQARLINRDEDPVETSK